VNITSFQAFLGRSVVTFLAVAGFALLAWADATSLWGAPSGWWLMPVAIAVTVAGVDELAKLFSARSLPLPDWVLRPGAVAVVLAAALGSPAPAAMPMAAMSLPAVAFMAVMIAVMLREIAVYDGAGRGVDRLAASVLVVAYVGFGMAFVVALRYVCVEQVGVEETAAGHLGIVPLASLVAAVKGGDIAAYLVGSLVGRRRMAPRLSPGKTWEGAAASVAASALVAWIVIEWAAPGIAARPLGGAVGYGLAVGVAGLLGDLAESFLKRELGAKDSGRSLAALGGVLDLADSLLLAAPVAWILWVVRLPIPG
jgi:phosphatidate cytidylyltransferase